MVDDLCAVALLHVIKKALPVTDVLSRFNQRAKNGFQLAFQHAQFGFAVIQLKWVRRILACLHLESMKLGRQFLQAQAGLMAFSACSLSGMTTQQPGARKANHAGDDERYENFSCEDQHDGYAALWPQHEFDTPVFCPTQFCGVIGNRVVAA